MKTYKIAILLSYICVASVSAAIITPALPEIQKNFALTHGLLEWIISIFLIGYVIGQLIYGPLANRFGPLKALRIGLFINLVGVIICIISTIFHLYALLLIGRLITALGAASGLSCTFMLINGALPESTAKTAIGFSIVSFTVGIGLAILLGGLLTQYLNWQSCFYVLFVHGLIMYCLSYLYKEVPIIPKSLNIQMIFSGYVRALKSQSLIVFALCVGLVSAFAYGFSVSAPIYAHNDLHLNAAQYGYWNIVNMIGMLLGGFLGAYLIQKISMKSILFTGLGLMVVGVFGLFTLILTHNHLAVSFFLITAFLYLISGLIFPAGSYFAVKAIEDKMNAASMMSFVNMGSATLGVIILGYLSFSALTDFVLVLAGFLVIIFSLLLFSKIPEHS